MREAVADSWVWAARAGSQRPSPYLRVKRETAFSLLISKARGRHGLSKVTVAITTLESSPVEGVVYYKLSGLRVFIFFLNFIFGCAKTLLLCVGFLKSWCTGFSLHWLFLLWSTGSRELRLSSCGTRAELSLGMWDLPRPGIKPESLVSPALAGGFFTTSTTLFP